MNTNELLIILENRIQILNKNDVKKINNKTTPQEINFINGKMKGRLETINIIKLILNPKKYHGNK